MAINKLNLNGTVYDIGEAEGTNTAESIVEFDSNDELDPSVADESVALIKSGDTHKSLWEKMSAGMKNIRYLLKQVTSLNSALADLDDNKISKNDSGSSFTATVNTGGYLTSSNSNVLFMIAITSKDRTIDSITTNSTQVRQNGNYLTGSSSGAADFPSGASTTFSQNALGTRVTWVFPSSIGGTNNDAVGVCGTLTVKFK